MVGVLSLFYSLKLRIINVKIKGVRAKKTFLSL